MSIQPDVNESNLPSVRFVDRFELDGDVVYARQNDHKVELWRVAGQTEHARSLAHHDAAIYNNTICSEVVFEKQYDTIDLYHHMAGRVASLRADRVLDEPLVVLEEVDRL